MSQRPLILVDPDGQWEDPVLKPEVRSHISGRRDPSNNHFGKYKRHRRGHEGIDLRTRNGEPIFAVGSGTVVSVTNAGAFGKRIVVRFTYHYTDKEMQEDIDNGISEDIIMEKAEMNGKVFYASYAHLQDVEVGLNDRVEEGDIIGTTGSSGNARFLRTSERHLHFSILTKFPTPFAGKTTKDRVDPEPFFKQLDIFPDDNRYNRDQVIIPGD